MRREDEFSRENLLSMNPNVTEEWSQMILQTGTKMKVFKGQNVYTIDGIPVTIFQIREKYFELKAQLQKELDESVNKDKKVVPLQQPDSVFQLSLDF